MSEFEHSEVTVKTTVQFLQADGLRETERHFGDWGEALRFVCELIEVGKGFAVCYSLWEEGELLEGEYPARKEAEDDARRMNRVWNMGGKAGE